jgi:IS30 family transposase
MPKNAKKQLTEFEKGKIIAWHEVNIPKKEIARKLGRTPKAIRYVIKNFARHGTSQRKIGSGRKSATTNQDKMIKKLALSKRFITADKIRKDLKLNVSDKTVRRRLNKCGLKCRVAAKKNISKQITCKSKVGICK